MDNFPGNSRRAASEPGQPEASSSPIHEPVVSRPVTPRKKPLGQRLKETFIAESAGSVVTFVISEVVVPQVKNLFQDALNSTIDRMFNGTAARARTTNRFSTGTNTHVSYNRYATRPTQATSTMSNGQSTARGPADPRDSADLGVIVLDTRPEAEEILDTLMLDIDQYKRVSVASLMSLIGQTPTPQDHRWGWKDLSEAEIKRITGGYLLALPPTEDLR